jgi:N-acetylglucosamine-6-phosphate deacetylase
MGLDGSLEEIAIMRCALLLSGALTTAAWAGPIDEPSPRPNGPFEHHHRCHALVGADVVTEPGTRLEKATIILRDGRIESIGVDAPIPADARLWPMQDQIIYAGFIEPAMHIDIEVPPAGHENHWNDQIHPQLDLGSGQGLTALSASDTKSLRKAGYCVAAIYPDDGILRGGGAITTLPESAEQRVSYGPTPFIAAAFDRSGWGNGKGPGSLMGSIALVRQTLSDAAWYAAAHAAAERNGLEPPSRRDDLAALEAVVDGTRSLLVNVRDEKEAMRAGRLARELDFPLALIGSGDEFKDISGITSLNCAVIVPVKYPKRPSLSSIDDAMRVPLRGLQEWEQAPTNLRRLQQAGVTTCVTTETLKKPSDVHESLEKAIKAGLDSDAALAQITTEPAALLGLGDRLGSLKPGMAAHLVVCDGDLFDSDTKILETWVSGHRHDHERDPLVELSGSGTILIGDTEADATLDTAKTKLNITLPDDTKVKVKKVSLSGHRLSAAIDGRILGMEHWLRLAGVVRGDRVLGRVVLPDGTSLPMHLVINEAGAEDDQRDDDTGEPTEDTDEPNTPTLAGSWVGSIQLGSEFSAPIEIVVEHADETITGTLLMMEQEMPLGEGTWDEETGSIAFQGDDPTGGAYSVAAMVDGDTIEGVASSPMGDAEFTVSRATDDPPVDTGEDATLRWTGIPEQIPYPLGARGRLSPIQPQDIRFEHATLWTAGEAGIIDDGCLVVRDGRIAYAGPMAGAPDSTEQTIDTTGLHITPGLIDCHSHTGIDGGVNEFNKACTAEVGIGDVVAGDDMNWYRQLAGGLTGANQLHGSANPIGGRNSVVKIRWGQPARGFPNAAAPRGIKFALGENVKRSSGRYPDTRMGVEAFIRDRLSEARAYAARWERWNAMSSEQQSTLIPPRRDYEFDTLAEILAGDRLIHCHSYRQDEILALLRTCEDFGITIGTLQHILEGYKVADDIAAHGCGASSFSDWWAYKLEVMDAIPWNGAIMHDQGVVVSFNSDDGELASRMNDEAAKAVRFGGLPPEEAIKFVTLNPAIQLHIDDSTGSLEAGKDADFAIWNRDPLDSYSLCMQTWIDGTRYFDRSEDAELAARDAADRQRLVEVVLLEGLGKPPELAKPEDATEEDATPAWVRNPYDTVDDHRGCCGIPAEHEESMK